MTTAVIIFECAIVVVIVALDVHFGLHRPCPPKQKTGNPKNKAGDSTARDAHCDDISALIHHSFPDEWCFLRRFASNFALFDALSLDSVESSSDFIGSLRFFLVFSSISNALNDGGGADMPLGGPFPYGARIRLSRLETIDHPLPDLVYSP